MAAVAALFYGVKAAVLAIVAAIALFRFKANLLAVIILCGVGGLAVI